MVNGELHGNRIAHKPDVNTDPEEYVVFLQAL